MLFHFRVTTPQPKYHANSRNRQPRRNNRSPEVSRYMSTVRAGTGEVDGYEPALHDADDAKDLQFRTDLLASHIDTVAGLEPLSNAGVVRPGTGRHSTTARTSKAATKVLKTMISDGAEVELGLSRKFLRIADPGR